MDNPEAGKAAAMLELRGIAPFRGFFGKDETWMAGATYPCH